MLDGHGTGVMPKVITLFFVTFIFAALLIAYPFSPGGNPGPMLADTSTKDVPGGEAGPFVAALDREPSIAAVYHS